MSGPPLARFRPEMLLIIALVVVVTAVAFVMASALVVAAARIYNTVVATRASGQRVPVPSFGRAALIVLLHIPISLLARLGVHLVASSLGMIYATTEATAAAASVMLLPLVYILNISALFTALLPTKFYRAVLVGIFHFLLVLTVGGIFFGTGLLIISIVSAAR